MGFQQGLSGLSASSQQLNVIGNNVANANTVGFKGSTAEFADIYAASLIGSGAPQIGIGTTLASVAQEFTQGNIQTTSNSLDLAINGSGFFRLDNNGTISYTRNGQFQLDQNGYIVNSTGQRLMGNSATSLNGSTPVDLQINTSDLQPVTTTSVTGQMNLNSNSPIINQTTTPFNASDSTSYTNSTAVTVYDNLGNSHTMQNYFVKTAANSWNVYTTVDGTSVTPTPTPQIVFNSSGAYDKTASTVGSISYTPTTGASAMSMTLDYSSSTQYGSTFSVNQLSQNGYTSGKLSKFSIGSDGMIVGSYSNGQTQNLGRVVMANFVNPNGLQSIGGNQWVPTSASGTELVGTPGTSTMGKIQSSALEQSNVDLTSELVNMITAQRSYQANAQTIKAEDQVMQTLVNL